MSPESSLSCQSQYSQRRICTESVHVLHYSKVVGDNDQKAQEIPTVLNNCSVDTSGYPIAFPNFWPAAAT